MKTLFTFALAMSMYLTGIAEPTNELSMLSRVSFNEQHVKVTLLEGIGRVKVSVKNEKGSTLYCISKKVTENMIMPINLESLPAGKYSIRIQTKESSIDYDVETTAKEVKDYGFKAHVKNINNQYVNVYVYEKLEEGPIKVKIYDRHNRLLHREDVEGGEFARKYTFKNLHHSGMYFSLTDKKGNNQVFYL
jgi:hypothetical protein